LPGHAFKRPVSVLVVVATPAGDVLLLERTRPRGFWQSVTGSLDEGETPERAARRELLEETGIDGTDHLESCAIRNHFPIIEAWRHRYAAEEQINREHVFRLVVNNLSPIRLNPKEHLGYKWLPRHEAAGLATSWTNRIAILALAPSRYTMSLMRAPQPVK
jgi:dATP pyrophosphohydrolase